MDINNLKSCVSHDEAMIRSFVCDPEFAEYYLNAVKDDGDEEEIRDTQVWFDEAKKIRSANATYWNDLIGHAKDTANSGYNIGDIISKVSQALEILKAALPTNIQQESRPAMTV